MSDDDLIRLDKIEPLLDAHGLGHGPTQVSRVGNGLSHVTFRLQREGADVILRRPPRPPLAHGAHDVIREARLLSAVREHHVRAPRVLLMYESTDLLDVPFYVMEAVHAHVLTDGAPDDVWRRINPPLMMEDFIRGLVEIHAVPVRALEFIRRSQKGTFADRQISRWTRTWDTVKWRSVPDIDAVTTWLDRHRPSEGDETLMHGDYRIGNVMFGGAPDVKLATVLDWEMASLGNPVFDLAYTLAFYPRPDEEEAGLLLGKCEFATEPGYPSRQRLVDLYTQMSGREVRDLKWHLACTIWRTAIGIESLYSRDRSGTSDIQGTAALGDEVLVLGRRAMAVIEDRFRMD